MIETSERVLNVDFIYYSIFHTQINKIFILQFLESRYINESNMVSIHTDLMYTCDLCTYNKVRPLARSTPSQGHIQDILLP